MCWSNLWANFPLLKCDLYEILFVKTIPLLFIIVVVASHLTFTADCHFYLQLPALMTRYNNAEISSWLSDLHLIVPLICMPCRYSCDHILFFAFLQRLYATIFCLKFKQKIVLTPHCQILCSEYNWRL
jgi:hypothetical protein